MNTDDDTSDVPLNANLPKQDKIEGPTFDIMSDEEIEVAHERLMGLIESDDESEAPAKDSKSS